MSTYFCYPENSISPESEDAFSREELDDIVGLVRESSFRDDISGKNIDERMSEVFSGSEPEWNGLQAQDGTCYVNCCGSLRHNGEEHEVILQFEISDDMESFILSGMLINGIEQPEGMIEQFEEQFSPYEWDYETDPANDEDEADDSNDWGDDAEERFWYGDDYGDEDDGCEYLDDYCDDDGCGCGHHHG